MVAIGGGVYDVHGGGDDDVVRFPDPHYVSQSENQTTFPSPLWQ